MKKILILFFAILSFSVYAEEHDNVSVIVQSPGSCVSVGNVSAEVREYDNDALITFLNYNTYKVSVSYTIYALTPDYRQVQAGGGSVTIRSGGVDSSSIRKDGGLHSYSIEISPMRCE